MMEKQTDNGAVPHITSLKCSTFPNVLSQKLPSFVYFSNGSSLSMHSKAHPYLKSEEPKTIKPIHPIRSRHIQIQIQTQIQIQIHTRQTDRPMGENKSKNRTHVCLYTAPSSPKQPRLTVPLPVAAAPAAAAVTPDARRSRPALLAAAASTSSHSDAIHTPWFTLEGGQVDNVMIHSGKRRWGGQRGHQRRRWGVRVGGATCNVVHRQIVRPQDCEVGKKTLQKVARCWAGMKRC